ncbi:AI-2E family transporter [Parablastomonas sp. CN1-191]|uniref:AI-2E family transporter n=1 Tax=Parablastomonas sp. CN1-191 TaxID=3400908 RepID=UPI003BF7A424
MLPDDAIENETPAAMDAQEIRLVSALVVILGIGLFLALPFVLSQGSVVFLPLVTALILSIVLSPLADRLASWGVPNTLASFIALVLFLGFLIAVVLLILQPAIATFDKVPQMLAKISTEITSLRSKFSWINDVGGQLAKATGHAQQREVVIAQPTVVEQVAVATPSVVLEVFFTLLMTFFMLESRTRMRRRLLLERASFGASLKAARVLRQVQDRVAGYILTVAAINFCVGIIAALGAWAFGFEAPIMWGGIAFVLNFLPYVGPLTMVAVLGVFGLANENALLPALAPAAAYLSLHAVESNIVTPSILGVRFTVSPVWILLSISYWTWIWGVIGALLSVPILLTVAALIEHLGKPNIIGFLFGEPLFPEPLVMDDEPEEDSLIQAPKPA